MQLIDCDGFKQTDDGGNLESHKQFLVDQWESKVRDTNTIIHYMNVTHSLRRDTITKQEEVWETIQLFPPLRDVYHVSFSEL